MEAESREQMQARHRTELRELQGRITNKKKNATKKTRKGVNDECAEMERRMREVQAAELASLDGDGDGDGDAAHDDGSQPHRLQQLQQTVEETLGKATEKLLLTDAAPTPTAGPKRNRQKERLARRAAEQEAAALRAEEEAASMTDHRARESEYMNKTFQAHGLVEKAMNPDGHCLFSAVADQLGHNAMPLLGGGGGASEPAHKTVRRAAATYMMEHADDFAPFLDEDLGAYAVKMRDTAAWGGQLELMALARRYGVEIRVVQDGRTEVITDDGEAKATGKTLWLAYYRHGYGLGEHYNSLRKGTSA